MYGLPLRDAKGAHKNRTAGEDGENGGPYGILRFYYPPSFIPKPERGSGDLRIHRVPGQRNNAGLVMA
jgi:hypothetical protein